MSPAPSSPADLPCAICARALKAVDAQFPTQPHRAQVFISHGMYGATCFDPMDETTLAINICQNCLHHLASQRRVAHETQQGRTTWIHGIAEHPEVRPSPA